VNGIYWTLVYKVQFYAADPLLLWCVRRAGFAAVGLFLLAAEVYFAYAQLPYECFFLARYFEWFLGVLAAEYISRHSTRSHIAAFAAAGLREAGQGIQTPATGQPNSVSVLSEVLPLKRACVWNQLWAGSFTERACRCT
jgi:peptidoglycan/LPS O-acetylase OafA/YrhL